MPSITKKNTVIGVLSLVILSAGLIVAVFGIQTSHFTGSKASTTGNIIPGPSADVTTPTYTSISQVTWGTHFDCFIPVQNANYQTTCEIMAIPKGTTPISPFPSSYYIFDVCKWLSNNGWTTYNNVTYQAIYFDCVIDTSRGVTTWPYWSMYDYFAVGRNFGTDINQTPNPPSYKAITIYGFPDPNFPLLTPASGTTNVLAGQNFTWGAFSTAPQYYTIYIGNDPTLATDIFERNIVGTSTTYTLTTQDTALLTSHSVYYWSICAWRSGSEFCNTNGGTNGDFAFTTGNPSPTPTPTSTPTQSTTPTQTPSSSPTSTITHTPTPTPTHTNTPTPTHGGTPTTTPIKKTSPTPTKKSTPTPSQSSTSTPTQTITASPTSTEANTLVTVDCIINPSSTECTGNPGAGNILLIANQTGFIVTSEQFLFTKTDASTQTLSTDVNGIVAFPSGATLTNLQSQGTTIPVNLLTDPNYGYKITIDENTNKLVQILAYKNKGSEAGTPVQQGKGGSILPYIIAGMLTIAVIVMIIALIKRRRNQSEHPQDNQAPPTNEPPIQTTYGEQAEESSYTSPEQVFQENDDTSSTLPPLPPLPEYTPGREEPTQIPSLLDDTSNKEPSEQEPTSFTTPSGIEVGQPQEPLPNTPSFSDTPEDTGDTTPDTSKDSSNPPLGEPYHPL